ncbi:MAG TPA: type II toxin-antitoxin system RelE/ParE family toxin [Caulobacteraceae bacterium]|nr:type II toxin-antitoxin system RelE/ParE family toxin [Caulobacteraceae bacterium]
MDVGKRNRSTLTNVVKYDYKQEGSGHPKYQLGQIGPEGFRRFSSPVRARARVAEALTVVADGATPDMAKPLTGLGSGIWELAIKERGDAYRVVYALQIDEDIWVIHAFQKKSKTGIATPKQDIDLVKERIKRLKEALA